MTKILAFDLGTNYGYCVKDGSQVHFGGSTLKDKKHGARFKQFHHELTYLFNLHKPDIVSYELVRRFMSSDAAYIYCGLRAIMLVAAHEFGCEVLELSPTEIKKAFTGDGKAKKPDVISRCIELGHAIPFYNNRMPAKCDKELREWHQHFGGDLDMANPHYLAGYYSIVIPYLDDNIADAVAIAYTTKV